MSSRVWLGSLAIAGLLAACAAGSSTSPAEGNAAGDSTSTSSGAGGATASSTSGTSGEAGFAPFDAGGSSGDAQKASCQFVDLLFVIDNSPSMGKYQDALALAFPGFVDAMYAKLPPNVDFHVGIVTTSFFTGSCSESVVNCVSAQTPAEIEAHYTKPQDGNTGTNGEQGRLFEHDGKTFFAANTSDADTSALKTWFASAAVAAGETGCSYEMPSAAAGYAAHAANEQHNAGFFRDEDAVLVVFFLSDEPDKSPEGTPAYHDMLSSRKSKCGGDACILTAGLVDSCIEGVNNELWKMLNAFGEPPIVGDIDDEAGYTKVIGDALAQIVKTTCDEIGVPK